MKKYFILIENGQAGPFSFDELYAKRISPNTMIWTEGLQHWTPAGQLPELKALWGAPPPPPPQYQQSSMRPAQQPTVSKKKSGNPAMIILIIFLVVGGIAVVAVIANNKKGGVGSAIENASYES